MAHTFHRLTAHVHWLSPDSTTDRPVLGAISGAHGTLVVDAGASPAHARVLQNAIAAARLPAPRFLALTHWHWDHIFGVTAWDVPTCSSVATRRIMAELAQLDWRDAALDARVAAGTEIAFCRDMIKLELPDRRDLMLRPPDIAFTDQMNIDLGGVTCELIYVGGDHASDSIVVYVPEDRVAFLSDCYYRNLYHTPPCYTTANLLPLLDRILALDAEFYLVGHDTEPLSRAMLAEEAALLAQIGRTVDDLGGDRAAVLAALPARLGRPVDEDATELVDEFLAGLT